MRSIMRTATMAMFLAVAFTMGCSGDTHQGPEANCNTDVDSITSPASGVATLHGSFFQDESVIIQETDGTHIASGTPSSNRDAFSLDGIPSGTHTYEIVISCESGQQNLGSFQFTVQ